MTVRLPGSHQRTGLRPVLSSGANSGQCIALLYANRCVRPKECGYSTNFLLLGLLVDRVAGEPLDQFAAQEAFAPAGMSRTMFHTSRSLYESVAPPGSGMAIPRVVNDQNAVRFGEVAGHAGPSTRRTCPLPPGSGSPRMGDRRVFEAVTIRFPSRAPRAETGSSGGAGIHQKEPVAAGTSSPIHTATGWTGTEGLDPSGTCFDLSPIGPRST